MTLASEGLWGRARWAALAVALMLATGCGASNPTQPSTGSGTLEISDLTVGTGVEATIGRVVAVNYTGWLLDASRPERKGTQFDSSVGRGAFSFRLGAGSVIAGWEQGVPGMRIGGKRRLVIPPQLAYGSGGSGPIPPNATLIFDIDLVGVQ